MKQKELTIISIKDDIVVVEGEHSYQFLEEIKFDKELEIAVEQSIERIKILKHNYL